MAILAFFIQLGNFVPKFQYLFKNNFTKMKSKWTPNNLAFLNYSEMKFSEMIFQ